jgi:hypothetical protein
VSAENDAVEALVALPDSDYLFHNGEWWVRSIAAREAVSENKSARSNTNELAEPVRDPS